LIKNGTDKSELKTLLYKNYRGFRECYKYFSGIDPVASLPAINTLNYTAWVQEGCPGLVDNITLKLADTDLEFIATNAGKSSKRNPANYLVRHNIMEVFARIAKTKYLTNAGEASTYAEAM